MIRNILKGVAVVLAISEIGKIEPRAPGSAPADEPGALGSIFPIPNLPLHNSPGVPRMNGP